MVSTAGQASSGTRRWLGRQSGSSRRQSGWNTVTGHNVGSGAEEGVEEGGGEGGDVGDWWDAAGGGGLGAPTAEEAVDGGKEVLLTLGRWFWLGVVAIVELVEGFGGADEEADGGQIDVGLVADGFFAPDFGAVDSAFAFGRLGSGFGFHRGGGELDGAGEAELVRGAGEVLAGNVVLDLGIDRVPAGGQPLADFFDDLRDAAVFELEIDGDFVLRMSLDFNAFINAQVALAGLAGRATDKG
jgi:hypothetical protein